MRPLTIGEILDRAVTLFVKNAWLFLALSAVLYVPITIAQLSLGDFWGWYMHEFSRVIAQPNDPSVAVAFDKEMLQRMGPVGTITFLMLLVGGPLVAAAMAYVCGKVLAGATPTFGESLQFALTRWGRVVLYWLLWVVAFAAVFFGVMLVLGLFVVGLAAIVRSPWIAALFMIAVFLSLMFCGIVASVGASVGFMTLIVENAGVVSAFDSGIRRTMNRQMLWRSALAGLVIFALSIGFSIIASIAGFGLLASLKTGIPLIIINALVAMVQYGFFLVFVAVFYYDVRVRREGADLETMVARLA